MAGSSGNNNINQNHLVGFDPNPEIYDMIGFSTKNLQQIFNKQNDQLSAISDAPNESLMVWNNHHHQQYHQNRSFLVDNDHQSLRFGPSSSKNRNFQEQSYIRNSKYLSPAQELLSEFCNLGTKQKSDPNTSRMKGQDETSAIKKQSLYALDLLELQRRKTKLLQMVEEVDRKYKHYCDQMKAVVQSFEAVAGDGAASVYSALASRAMSRHFRCLKDGILDQLKAVKKVMGEKDVAVPGTMKGETPRLRVLDQTLRQQRALQQMSLVDSHPWRPQRGLPERSVSVLRAWLFEHFLHPYPSDVDKHILARQTGLSRSQVSNWFINARVRLWKPMVEEMYMEELKEDQDAGAPDVGGAATSAAAANPDENQHSSRNEDQKPTHDQLQNPSFGRLAGNHSYNATELDFSSYTGSSVAVTYANENSSGQNYGGGGVSLTLGLHQHGGASGEMSLAFSPASQNSLFFPRDHMEDCQTTPYSLLDSENQTLPYRNLMGAQLLHDLAG
ncbi:Transcription factor MEIS1 [Handroanthus impetiginosus]|uniref:Transcription factor MEIS1 n=1 Tax=Handroanthus impetiginosus TaxID=429701 RepID=A0A2G9GFE7_9LAMI|nr:Transcription factor MEIS1 [Handroanthus impetiginosus]